MATFKIEIQKEKKDGTRNIKIILIHKRKLKRIPTDIYITKADLTRSGKLKNQAIIDRVADEIKELRDKCNDIVMDGMTIEEVYSEITRKDLFSLDFIEIFKDYISNHGDIKGIKNYGSALNSMIKFIGREKMSTKDVTVKFLQDYSSSLGGRAQSLYLGCIRHVYEDAVLKYNDEEKGISPLSYSLFKKFKVPRQNVSEKRALDCETLRNIINLPYDETTRGKDKENRYNLAKDVFILSFGLIGMNSVDLYNCETMDKNTVIYQRTKTKERRSDRAEIHVVVHKQIEALVKKYRDRTGKKIFRFHMMYCNPVEFNKALNKGMKEVGKRIGVPDLTFYAARHTWATIARNDLNIDKNTVNDALNHIDESMRVTDIYIIKDFTTINKANEKVLKYVWKGL